MFSEKLKIALLLGGTSPEREVSKSSGLFIYKTLQKLNCKITLIDPAYGKNQPEKVDDFFSSGDYAQVSNRNYVEIINSSLMNNIDIAVLALHGKWGEDGTIQALLKLRGIKYTGSDVLASAIAMDKGASKILFHHFDVSTPNWFVVNSQNESVDLIHKKIEKFFNYPCIIKPNDQGSTIGLTICYKKEDIRNALNKAFNYTDKVLIEEYIQGREITVGVIEQKVLPVLEIIPKHNLYDYECKYSDGMSSYEVPAKLPENVTHHIQQQALLAYNSVGCKGYGRVDFRLSFDMKSYCLEVNTLPGMTHHSLIPKIVEAAGIKFEDFIEKIIRISL